MKRFELLCLLLCLVPLATLAQPLGAGKLNGTTLPAGDMSKLVNTTLLGSQPTKLPAKNGLYGISFNAVAATDLYTSRILNNLDQLIECGSVGLNPSNSQITEYLIDAALAQIADLEAKAGNTEVKSSPWSGNYRYYYAAFVNSMKQQLANTDYVTLMQADPITPLAAVVYKAGNDQCISYCQYPMQMWTMENSKVAGAYLAFKVDYLLGYNNAAKQNDGVFKMLLDAYTARKQGKLFGAYQPLVQRHGATVPFGLYGINVKLISWALSQSKDAQAIKYLWDTNCNCPDSDLYNGLSGFQTNAAFIVP